jgi:hypothetical protein
MKVNILTNHTAKKHVQNSIHMSSNQSLKLINKNREEQLIVYQVILTIKTSQLAAKQINSFSIIK